jgi:hypothetical protein
MLETSIDGARAGVHQYHGGYSKSISTQRKKAPRH